jgi:hypothetical protein
MLKLEVFNSEDVGFCSVWKKHYIPTKVYASLFHFQSEGNTIEVKRG